MVGCGLFNQFLLILETVIFRQRRNDWTHVIYACIYIWGRCDSLTTPRPISNKETGPRVVHAITALTLHTSAGRSSPTARGLWDGRGWDTLANKNTDMWLDIGYTYREGILPRDGGPGKRPQLRGSICGELFTGNGNGSGNGTASSESFRDFLKILFLRGFVWIECGPGGGDDSTTAGSKVNKQQCVFFLWILLIQHDFTN